MWKNGLHECAAACPNGFTRGETRGTLTSCRCCLEDPAACPADDNRVNRRWDMDIMVAEEYIQAAFAKAGGGRGFSHNHTPVTCTNTHDPLDCGDKCESTGAPYISKDDNLDDAKCIYGEPAASCDTVPPAEHRRLCECQAEVADFVQRYSCPDGILTVSDMQPLGNGVCYNSEEYSSRVNIGYRLELSFPEGLLKDTEDLNGLMANSLSVCQDHCLANTDKCKYMSYSR